MRSPAPDLDAARAAGHRARPTVGASELADIIARLRAAQRRLGRRPVASILDALGGVVAGWMDPQSPWRQAAERDLPAATGFSPEMIRFALPWMIEPLRSPALGELLDAELGDRRVLDSLVRGRLASGPALIAHVLAGNLTGTAALPLALSLAIKSAVLVKTASDDPVFPGLFARSIAEADAELGACVAACYWRGGDLSCEDLVFTAAQLVVASGSDASVASARSRCDTRFIGHGHQMSLALVAREVLRDPAWAGAAAAALALDVSVWDQRGCLSPQVCLVEGDFDAACGFGQRLAAELGRWATRLPPGRMTLDDHAAVRRFRDETEWRGLGGKPAAVLAPEASAAWTVAVEAETGFRPTPLCRSIRVSPVTALSEVREILAPARRVLAAAGIAGGPERLPEIQNCLAMAGVQRLCPLGSMQRPPLRWLQGGRPRVADWVTWSACDDTVGEEARADA